MNNSLGFLEVKGLTAALEGLDAMLKTADVRLVHTEKRLGGGGLVTVVVAGKVDAVTSAVEAGKVHAAKIDKVFASEVIPNPHEEVLKFYDMTNGLDK